MVIFARFMMRASAYQRWSGLLLLTVLGLFIASRALHTHAAHHSHADKPACEAGRDGHTTHLHDERYGPEGCDLCVFCLTVSSVPVMPSILVPLGGFADLQQLPPAVPCIRTACDTTHLRGPPVL